SVLPASGRIRPDPLRAALAAPGAARHVPEPLGGGDLWDGFGMWLALRDRAASIGVADDSPDAPGLAVVVLDPSARAGSPGPWPVRVRAFGPSGDALADRLLVAA